MVVRGATLRLATAGAGKLGTDADERVAIAADVVVPLVEVGSMSQHETPTVTPDQSISSVGAAEERSITAVALRLTLLNSAENLHLTL